MADQQPTAASLNAEAWNLVDDVALGNTEYDRLSEIAGDLLARARNVDLSGAASGPLSRAADMVLDAIDAPDTGVRDAINLVVNVAGHLLEHPDASLEDAIAASYQEEPETVLGWARGS